jgi:transcription initiation factor TFIIIB Brf1 subunit/transcription initiation factor TFIIB
MLSRWNSQILPIAETATSHAFAFSEIDRLGSFIKLPSSDNITENHKNIIKDIVVKLFN